MTNVLLWSWVGFSFVAALAWLTMQWVWWDDALDDYTFDDGAGEGGAGKGDKGDGEFPAQPTATYAAYANPGSPDLHARTVRVDLADVNLPPTDLADVSFYPADITDSLTAAADRLLSNTLPGLWSWRDLVDEEDWWGAKEDWEEW